MLRWLRVPVRTSFGVMHDRPAVLVRVARTLKARSAGARPGATSRRAVPSIARLIETVLAPLVVGRTFASPRAAFDELSAQTAVLAIQSGEPGPIAQAIAAVDTALHDLAARHAGLPLWRHLLDEAGAPTDAAATREVPVYASGINPERPGDTVTALREVGHTAFKLKVGFGTARDLDNLAAAAAPRARAPP